VTPARHLVLVGSMGSGKTTIGSLVADIIGLALVDSDRELAAEGDQASTIAREQGVAALHRRECTQLLAALAAPEPAVVAAAASTIEAPGCREALAGHVVAWLRADPATVASRLEDGVHRRDLGPDRVGALRALAARRDPLYAAAADVTVDVDTMSAADAAAAVAAAYATETAG
jgi:shikimate kinase